MMEGLASSSETRLTALAEQAEQYLAENPAGGTDQMWSYIEPILLKEYDENEAQLKKQLLNTLLFERHRERTQPSGVSTEAMPTAQSSRTPQLPTFFPPLNATSAPEPCPGQMDIRAQLTALINLTAQLAATRMDIRPSRKPKQSDPDKFNGTKSDYRRWKIQTQNKINEDRSILGSIPMYIFGLTTSHASQVCLALLEKYPSIAEDDLWMFCDQQFGDPLAEERARNQLQRYQQGRENLQKFNATFMSYAYSSGEENNRGYLKNRYLCAIRSDLRDKMITVEVPDEWDIQDLMKRVVVIEENMFRARLNSNPARGNAPRGNRGGAGRDRSVPSMEPMDWEYTPRVSATRLSRQEERPEPLDTTRVAMTRRGNSQCRAGPGRRGGFAGRGRGAPAKAAVWVSVAERTRRRENGQCIRCGDAGHFIRDCAQSSAIRPVQARSANTIREDQQSEEEYGDGSGSEAEN
jgi:hypothetical protein